jgi:hypothetical protein
VILIEAEKRVGLICLGLSDIVLRGYRGWILLALVFGYPALSILIAVRREVSAAQGAPQGGGDAKADSKKSK